MGCVCAFLVTGFRLVVCSPLVREIQREGVLLMRKTECLVLPPPFPALSVGLQKLLLPVEDFGFFSVSVECECELVDTCGTLAAKTETETETETE